MYNTILVPHAGTTDGDKALKHALFVAKLSSARIILLHVVEQIPRPPMFALASSEQQKLLKNIHNADEDIKKGMIFEMEKRAKICNENNIKAKIIVTIGLATDEILKIIKKEKADLVIMAKRRKLKGLKSLLTLGSVSRKIVENTVCPVLLVDIE